MNTCGWEQCSSCLLLVQSLLTDDFLTSPVHTEMDGFQPNFLLIHVIHHGQLKSIVNHCDDTECTYQGTSVTIQFGVTWIRLVTDTKEDGSGSSTIAVWCRNGVTILLESIPWLAPGYEYALPVGTRNVVSTKYHVGSWSFSLVGKLKKWIFMFAKIYSTL